jgi:hypothetical protein
VRYTELSLDRVKAVKHVPADTWASAPVEVGRFHMLVHQNGAVTAPFSIGPG